MARKMRLILLVLTGFTALAAPLSPAIAQDGRITVTGEGRMAAIPDMATIHVGVSEEAPTAAEALGQMSRRGESILAQLTEAGLEARDIQTSGLTLRPLYNSRSDSFSEEITGFVAETRFTVRVRDLPALGGILDEVVREAGANRLQSVEFALSDPGPARDEARRDAVADGQARAALYAEAAGVALGPLLSLDERTSGGMPIPIMEARMMDAASFVPIAEGEIVIDAQVTMVFAIAE